MGANKVRDFIIPLEESFTEESTECSETPLNEKFVKQFAALNIVLGPSDIDGWFQNDGPGCEHMNEQGDSGSCHSTGRGYT